MFSFEKGLLTILWKLFLGILILLYSIVISSTILGILGIFRFWFVIFSCMSIFFFLFYTWNKSGWMFPNIHPGKINSDNNENSNLLSLAGYFSAGILSLLILIPIMNWPMSAIGKTLNGDAGLYHFPKAVEMWLTGSVWDFTIPYADYPFGYESLLSFTLLFTKNVSAFSFAHLFIAIIIILGSWFLTLKYSKLPSGVILLGIVFLILSGFVNVPNPWYFLHHLPYTIGKNDLFLAAATISAMVFVPFHKDENKSTNWIGLGLASGLAISIKPNSVLILVFLWIYALFFTNIKNTRKSIIVISLIFASLGGGWIIRNLIGLKRLFLPHEIANLTIWANLNNPGFFQQIPNSFKFSLVLGLIIVIVSFVKNSRISKWDASLFIVSLISFMLTPASSKSDNPLGVVWRFGLTLLFLQFVYLLAILEPAREYILDQITRSKMVTWIISSLIVVTMCGYFILQIDILRLMPEYANLLERPYTDYNSEYASVSDYIDEHIHNSVVWIEGTHHFFAYDKEFTNSITRSKDADYVVIVNESPEEFWFNITFWDLVYQDSKGYIFKNPSIKSD